MSRIQWEKAKATISSLYAKNPEWPHLSYFAHCPTEWPQHFAPIHLAHLQAAPIGNDRSHTTVWQAAIESAAGAGELPNVLRPFNRVRGVWVSRPERSGGTSLGCESQGYTKNLPGVAADDFQTWLISQGETASEHISAWFNARCIRPAQTPVPVVTNALEPDAGAPKAASPSPLTTSQIAGCFAGFHNWNVDKWKENMQTPAPWLKNCRHQTGRQGKPIVESTWWPVQIAQALDKKHTSIKGKLHARFKNQELLKPWLELLENHLPNDVETLENKR